MKLNEDTAINNFSDGGRINGAKFKFRNALLRQYLIDHLFGFGERIAEKLTIYFSIIIPVVFDLIRVLL